MSEGEQRIADTRGRFVKAVQNGQQIDDANWTVGRIRLSNKRLVLAEHDPPPDGFGLGGRVDDDPSDEVRDSYLTHPRGRPFGSSLGMSFPAVIAPETESPNRQPAGTTEQLNSDDSLHYPTPMGSPPQDLPIEVPGEAVLLVAGPPMTGKYDLLLRLLATHANGAIIITTTHDAETVTDDYCTVGDVSPEQVGVVECTGGDAGGDGDRVRTASLENLTGVGVEFTELFASFHERNGPTGVGVHSLSALLMHADLQTVYQFLLVLTGQVRNAAWPGAAVINDEMTDPETLATITQQFDGVVQTRQGADGRELRLKGLDPAPTPWRPF